MGGEEREQLPLQHCCQVNERLIQITLVLWSVRFWNIVRHIQQRLLMMLGDDGEGRAVIGFQAEAPADEREGVIGGER